MHKFLILLAACLLLNAPGALASEQEKDTDFDEPPPPKVPAIARPFLSKFVDKVYFWRIQYYFVAQNAANCDLFYGLVQQDPLIGRAAVDFIFPNGCKCHGYALVTHYPHPRSVVGQSGFIKAKCTDGRVIRGKFTTTSLTTGNGTATDNQGNSYQITFGHTAEKAVKEVNELRKKLGCEECTPQDVELRVTGRVLPPANDSSR